MKRLGARFFLLIALLTGCALQWGEPFAEALLPLFKIEIQRLDPPFRINGLSIVRDQRERVIRLEVSWAQALTVNGHTFYPNPRGMATSSTIVANLTLPTVVLLATTFAIPAQSLRLYGRRSLYIVVAAPLLWTLGVPMILRAGIWDLVYEVADPHRVSPLIVWVHFLLAGGQVALPAVLGGLIAASDLRSRKLSVDAADRLGGISHQNGP